MHSSVTADTRCTSNHHAYTTTEKSLSQTEQNNWIISVVKSRDILHWKKSHLAGKRQKWKKYELGLVKSDNIRSNYLVWDKCESCSIHLFPAQTPVELPCTVLNKPILNHQTSKGRVSSATPAELLDRKPELGVRIQGQGLAMEKSTHDPHSTLLPMGSEGKVPIFPAATSPEYRKLSYHKDCSTQKTSGMGEAN